MSACESSPSWHPVANSCGDSDVDAMLGLRLVIDCAIRLVNVTLMVLMCNGL
jgi:hypothetical protein